MLTSKSVYPYFSAYVHASQKINFTKINKTEKPFSPMLPVNIPEYNKIFFPKTSQGFPVTSLGCPVTSQCFSKG